MRNKFPFFSGLVVSLFLLWPMLAAPYFSHHDDMQATRLYEMHQCFKDFQFPCRWVPDLGGEYGYPLYNYYAPLAYYYGEIWYLITGNLILSAKIMFSTAFIGGYIFMYLLGRRLWGEWGGSLSGIFFSYAPYHASLLYVRGAMGELWGIMFFPLILWGALKLKEKSNLRFSVLLALTIAGLATAHNLSTMLFLPIFVLFVLIIGFKQKKFLCLALISLILGLSLSAFYILPAKLESDLVHVDSTYSGYFYFTEHFKGLRKLILDRSWGWGASVLEVNGALDGMSFQIGWIHLLGWILSLFAGLKLWKDHRSHSLIIVFASTVVIGSMFMINVRSQDIWKALDWMKYIQFPWRFLGIIIFGISMMVGSIFLVIANKYIFPIWAILTFCVTVYNVGFFYPERFSLITDQALRSGKVWDSQIKRSIFDYLPIYAKAPPAELATIRYEVLSGDADIKNYREGSNWISFDASAKIRSVVRLSQYYFPDWVITIDKKNTDIDYKNDLGLMTINLDPGDHLVEAKLHDSGIRRFGNYTSLIGALVAISFIYYGRNRNHN